MRDTEVIVYQDLDASLGIKVMGGVDSSKGKHYGIFVRRVLVGGFAADDGRLNEADQILTVNGHDLEMATRDEAIRVLREAVAVNCVDMIVTRDEKARKDFLELCDNVGDTHSVSDGYSSGGSLISDILESGQDWDGRGGDSGRPTPTSQHHSSLSCSSPGDDADAAVTRADRPGKSILKQKHASASVSSATGNLPDDYFNSVLGTNNKGTNDSTSKWSSGFPGSKSTLPEPSSQRSTQRNSSTREPFMYSAPERSIDESREASLKAQNGDIQFGIARLVHPASRAFPPAQSNLKSFNLKPSLSSTPTVNSQSKRLIASETVTGRALFHSPGNFPLSEEPSPVSAFGHMQSTVCSQQTLSSLAGEEYGIQRGDTTGSQDSGRSAVRAIDVSRRSGEADGCHNDRERSSRARVPPDSELDDLLRTRESAGAADDSDVRYTTVQFDEKAVPAPSGASPPRHASLFPRLAGKTASDFYAEDFSVGDNVRHVSQYPAASPLRFADISDEVATPQRRHGDDDDVARLRSFAARRSRKTRFTLDDDSRVKLDKLTSALRYVGVDPSEEQREELRARLYVDDKGCVKYGEFVAMVKELFEKDFNLSALNFSSLLSESTFCTTAQDAGHLAASSSQVDDTATSQGYVSLLHNHEKALRDIATLRKAVRQRDTACLLAEQELLCVRSNAQEAIAETRALRARVRMSEAAAAQARHVETDYDQVVSLLESELAKLASQNPNRKQAGQRDQPFTAPPSELSDILALLQRKEESKNNYAAALDILLQFVYELQKVLSSLGGRNGTALRPSQGVQDENKGGDVSQASLARHRNAVSFLTMRAKETLTQIRASLKDETLPLVFSDKPSLDVSTASRKQTTLNASVTRPCVQLSPVLELQGSTAGTSGMSV